MVALGDRTPIMAKLYLGPSRRTGILGLAASVDCSSWWTKFTGLSFYFWTVKPRSRAASRLPYP